MTLTSAQAPGPDQLRSSSTRALHDLRNASALFVEYVRAGDLLRVHGWDQLTGPAVNTLFMARALARSGQEESLGVAIINLGRILSNLHDAVHGFDQSGAEASSRQLTSALADLDQYYPADFLSAVNAVPDAFTCPMHPSVAGERNGTCPVCGMALVPAGPFSSLVPGAPTLHVGTVRWSPALSANQQTRVFISLQKADGSPVLPRDLLVAHTKKIHLLIIDDGLTDYHHEHPEPTAVPGEYVFQFTPRLPGSYRVWADLLPADTGRQEYSVIDLTSASTATAPIDRTERTTSVVNGLTYQLLLDEPTIRAGKAVRARLHVTYADGRLFTALEPVMGAFGHLVGFAENRQTVLHSHPLGLEPASDAARGGPDLSFYIYSADPGFIRLFAQVQIDGIARFADFGLRIQP